MRTLGRRVTKRARKFRVTHPKHNQQRHQSRGYQPNINVDMQIDLDIGRTEGDYRPRVRSKHPTVAAKISRDYRPPDYKPSWDPEELCVMCLEKAGMRYMPVLFKNEESGILDTWHYECLLAWLDAKKWVDAYEAQEFLLEEVAV